MKETTLRRTGIEPAAPAPIPDTAQTLAQFAATDGSTRKLYIRTFGCQMNEYDSDKMADVLRENEGLELTDDPEQAGAGKSLFRPGPRQTPEANQAGTHHRRGRLCRQPGRRRHRGARALC
jgi:hypothetical protein